jgi:hypothetical protein
MNELRVQVTGATAFQPMSSPCAAHVASIQALPDPAAYAMPFRSCVSPGHGLNSPTHSQVLPEDMLQDSATGPRPSHQIGTETSTSPGNATAENVDEAYFDSYSYMDIHRQMLEDKERTGTYRCAPVDTLSPPHIQLLRCRGPDDLESQPEPLCALR